MERDLYLGVVDDLSTWAPDLSSVPAPFVAFCALDVKDDDAGLEAFASRVMAAGCLWVCGGGPDGEIVHDAFDAVFIRENPGKWDDDSYVVTTCDESIDEELWFAIFQTGHPWKAFPSVLALVSPRYAEQVERRLADSEQLDADVVGDESS